MNHQSVFKPCKSNLQKPLLTGESKGESEVQMQECSFDPGPGGDRNGAKHCNVTLVRLNFTFLLCVTLVILC